MQKFLHLVTAMLMLAVPTAAAIGQDKAPTDEQKRQIVESMNRMLQRAEVVRMLAAEHLNYLDSQQSKADIHLMEDATQVMAYSLICNDEALDPQMLNRIASEVTLSIALAVDGSPAEESMRYFLGELPPAERTVLVADISSTILMFKIGRRRGLFDALLTDFGNARFCKGMGASMHDRYNALISSFEQIEPKGQ